MAILRQLNEFTRESVVMALEPSRHCISSCTYCFAALNSKYQHGNRSKSLKDDQSFERTLEKAYSHNYDPSNFSQYALRNRFILGYSNTVEPFQDESQAISLLKILDKYSIPIFVQTKGVSFWKVVSYLEPFKDNSSIFVSIPSLDQRVAKRFEPGTPPIADRLKIIEALSDLDFYTISALSPYHEDWNEDPELLVNTLANCGTNQIFYDRLHLNSRQVKVADDHVMVSLAGGRGKHWPEKAMDHLRSIYYAALDNDLEFFANGFQGTMHGYYNTTATINPDYCFGRGTVWPYYDGFIFQVLENVFYDESLEITPVNRDYADSILVTWDDALRIMHSIGRIDQPFSYSSLMDLVPIYKKIPTEWKRSIGIKSTKDCAQMSEYFRALWNNPYRHQFMHRHPWTRVVADMNGVPVLDSEGNLLVLFDPDYDETHNRYFRKVESLDMFRRLEHPE